jgi:hypothetical protein
MAQSFEDKAIFETAYSAALTEAARTANAHPVASNHVTMERIMSEENFKVLVYTAWRMTQLPNHNPDRDALTYEKVKLLFSTLGFGDINRFRPEDSEDWFNNHGLTKFMTDHIIYLIREKQNACARCNLVVDDSRHGAFGFDSDHIFENFRMDNEETRKTCSFGTSGKTGLFKKLFEGAMTQLTCKRCHLDLTINSRRAHKKHRSDLIREGRGGHKKGNSDSDSSGGEGGSSRVTL